MNCSVTSGIVLPCSTTLSPSLKLRGSGKLRRAGFWAKLVARDDTIIWFLKDGESESQLFVKTMSRAVKSHCAAN